MAVSKSNRKILILSAATLVVLFFVLLFRDSSSSVTTKQAIELAQNGNVLKVIKTDKVAYLQLKNSNSVRIPVDQLKEIPLENVVVEVDSSTSFMFWFFLFMVFLVIAALVAYIIIKQRKSVSKIETKKEHSIHAVNDDLTSSVVAMTSDVSFNDVAGIEDVKSELFEVIAFLKDPKKFSQFGVRMPRGLLLVGPPGVGKTMIAKAVAGEAGVPFYYQSASSFVQIYVGMGAKRVRELFMEAKRNAPSIIFIDEIDAVGKMRSSAGRNDERDATLNQLLTEMDGFDSNQSGVIVIAATNKIDVLDDALLRAGRFDRRIFVELPNINEREAIVAKYLETIPNAIVPKEVAKLTAGFSGASLATLINEAALKALREDKIMVHMQDVEAVKSKVKEGKKRIKVLKTKEKEQQAYHQAARAVVAYAYGFSFSKVALMYDDIAIVRDTFASTKALIKEISFSLCTIAIMKIRFDEHFVNSEKELSAAKRIAADMVRRYGMGSSLMGDISDEKHLLDQGMQEAILLLKRLEFAVQNISDVLKDKELITFEQIKEACDAIL